MPEYTCSHVTDKEQNETKRNKITTKNMTIFRLLVIIYKQKFSATPFTKDFAVNYATIALR